MTIKRFAGDIHWNELNQCTEPLSQPSFDLRKTSTSNAIRESNIAHFIPDVLDGKSMIEGIVLRSTASPYPYVVSGVEKLYSEFMTVNTADTTETEDAALITGQLYWRYEVMVPIYNPGLPATNSVLDILGVHQQTINYHTTAMAAPGLWGSEEEGKLEPGTFVDIMYENTERGRVPHVVKVNLDRAIQFSSHEPVMAQFARSAPRRVTPVAAGVGGTFRTAMVIGDSMSSTPLSVGGRIGKMLKDRGFEVRTHKPVNYPGVRGGNEGSKGVSFRGHPLGVATYPGQHVPYLLKKGRLQKILANFNAELLVVILGANSASSALAEGTYMMSRRARGLYKTCSDIGTSAYTKLEEHKKLYWVQKDDGTWLDPLTGKRMGLTAKGKRFRSCFQVAHKQRKSLAKRETIYKTQLKTFVQTAFGAGVKYIIWLGPSYMSGYHGKDQYGPNGLEWGAENIRRWQKETLEPLGVEWHDSEPMTRNIRPGHDGLHFGTKAYGEWASTASKVIFNNVEAGVR